MEKNSVFDTTISSYNLGNQIIMESVYKHLSDLLPNDFFFKLPTIEITKYTEGYLNQSNKIFYGGTNALSSKMESYNQWGLNLLNCHKINDVILMGVGWWQYQDINTSFYTKYILSKVLSSQYFHSVRDSYTQQKLNDIGLKNVLNTGCPTLWDLTEKHCQSIPQTKGKDLIITFTDYNKDIINDTKLIQLGLKYYSNVYFWIQGSGDFDYLSSFKISNIHIIPPTLVAFDSFLKNNDVDYIGTRLHAGIRALQNKKRTLILSVDNRATEMGSDFNLPVVSRNDIDFVEKNFIQSIFNTDIKRPFESISQWKNQFL